MNEFNINAGKRIRELREEYGYTREKLAEYADMNDKYLYEVEVGKKGLSAMKMKKLADALGVTMDFLSSGEQNRENYYAIISLLNRFSMPELKNIENIIKNIIEISKSPM